MTNDEIDRKVAAYAEMGDEWAMHNSREDVPALAAEAKSRLPVDEDTAWVLLGSFATCESEGALDIPQHVGGVGHIERQVVALVDRLYPKIVEHYSWTRAVKAYRASKT